MNKEETEGESGVENEICSRVFVNKTKKISKAPQSISKSFFASSLPINTPLPPDFKTGGFTVLCVCISSLLPPIYSFSCSDPFGPKRSPPFSLSQNEESLVTVCDSDGGGAKISPRDLRRSGKGGRGL